MYFKQLIKAVFIKNIKKQLIHSYMALCKQSVLHVFGYMTL